MVNNILKDIALIGNILFILWIFYNAVDEGFKIVRPVELASLTGLIILLILNIYLILRKA